MMKTLPDTTAPTMNADYFKRLLQRMAWLFPSLVVAAFVASAGAFYWLQTRPVAQRNGQERMAQAVAQVGVKTTDLMSQVERSLFTMRDWGADGLLRVDDAPLLNRVMVPVLGQRSLVSSVHLATEDGRELLLLKGGNNTWKNRITDVKRNGKAQQWLEWTGTHQRLGEETRQQDYDPRARPWFNGAMGVPPGQVYWTEPYIFQSTKEPGITASVRWLDAKSGLSMVVAFDVLLLDLSRFTSELGFGEHGTAALLTFDGKVLGLPRHPLFRNDEDFKRGVLQQPGKLGLFELAAALSQWQSSGAQPNDMMEVNVANGVWLASLKPWPLRNQNFVIATMAPVSDFSPWTVRLVAVLAGLFAVALSLGVVLAKRFAQGVSLPMGKVFDELDASYRQLSREMARTSAVAELAPRLQDVHSLQALGQLLLADLAQRFALGQGSFYRADRAQQRLSLCSGYARRGDISPPEHIAYGEGLVGQCALECKVIVQNPPSEGYLKVASMLGTASPVALILLPVVGAEGLSGVLELAFLEGIGDDELVLLESLLPMVAMSMEITERTQSRPPVQATIGT